MVNQDATDWRSDKHRTTTKRNAHAQVRSKLLWVLWDSGKGGTAARNYRAGPEAEDGGKDDQAGVGLSFVHATDYDSRCEPAKAKSVDSSKSIC